MKSRIMLALSLAIALATTAVAQRPRTVPNDPPPSANAPAPPPAPATFKAKYEGGVFGYNHKIEGTLTFDDTNNRLLFRDQSQKELLSIPYNSVNGEYGDTQALRPRGAEAVSRVPVPYGLNVPAWFIKKKYRFLTIQFNDPDSKASGTTSFKLENKEILASVVATLAAKAGLTQRGEIYVRK